MEDFSQLQKFSQFFTIMKFFFTITEVFTIFHKFFFEHHGRSSQLQKFFTVSLRSFSQGSSFSQLRKFFFTSDNAAAAGVEGTVLSGHVVCYERLSETMFAVITKHSDTDDSRDTRSKYDSNQDCKNSGIITGYSMIH